MVIWDRGLSLRQGTIIDATLINTPSSTKNKDDKRDPQMHQTKKGNQYYFRMKAHIGVDDESGLVHRVVGTAANVADVTLIDKLLHGNEDVACDDAGYTGLEKRLEHEGREVIWQIAARRSTYSTVGDVVCPVESVDGSPTFDGQRRRGAPVMRKMAAARCL